MATMLTPDDVLAGPRTSPVTARSWGFGLGVRSLGSSISIEPQDRTALKSATTNLWRARYGTAVSALAAVAVACWAITTYIPHQPVGTNTAGPVDGLTIFAVFFVAALAIERLLEPLSNALLPKADLAGSAQDAMTTAKTRTLTYLDVAGADPEQCSDPSAPGAPPSTATAPTAAPDELANAANEAIKAAALALEQLDVRRLQRSTALWAIATCLGMAAAAAMNLYFLNTVGIAVGQPWEEILATGLIIGGGTKPLHDLVTLISAKSATAGCAD